MILDEYDSYVPALQETKRMRISRILNELYNDVSGKALLFNGGLKYLHINLLTNLNSGQSMTWRARSRWL